MLDPIGPRDPTIGPRRRLPLRFTRRQLFSAMVTEVQVARGRARGGKALKLRDLGAMSDPDLAVILPVVTPGCAIAVRDGFVWGQPASLVRPLQLFPAAAPALTAFNRFNGLMPLGAVGRHVAREMGWDEADGFAFARRLFLDLVEEGICQPS